MSALNEVFHYHEDKLFSSSGKKKHIKRIKQLENKEPLQIHGQTLIYLMSVKTEVFGIPPVM